MKIIILIFFISLLAFTIQRNTKKKKGSKSSNKMSASYKVFIHIDGAKHFSTGFIQTVDIQSPNNNHNKKGILINFTRMFPDLHPLAQKVQNTTSLYLLPYVRFSNNFNYVNRAFSGKKITNIFKSKKGYKSITIRFDYNTQFEVISEMDLMAFVGWMNINRQKRMIHWRNLKRQAFIYANSYYVNKINVDATSKGIPALDNTINFNNNHVNLLQKKQSIDSQLLKYMERELNMKEKELVELRSKQNNIISQMNNRLDLINNLVESVKGLTLQKSTGVTSNVEYQTKMDTAKASFLTIVKGMKHVNKNTKATVDKIIQELFTKNNIGNVVQLIHKLGP